MVNIRISQGDELVYEGSYPDNGAFWLMSFDGQDELDFHGELSLSIKTLKPKVKSWAKSWAESQDMESFRQAINDAARQWAIDNGQADTQPVTDGSLIGLTPDVLKARIIKNRSAIIKSMTEQYGKRNGRPAGHVIVEMLLAMIERYRESASAVQTVWVCPGEEEKIDISGILDLLFKRRAS